MSNKFFTLAVLLGATAFFGTPAVSQAEFFTGSGSVDVIGPGIDPFVDGSSASFNPSLNSGQGTLITFATLTFDDFSNGDFQDAIQASIAFTNPAIASVSPILATGTISVSSVAGINVDFANNAKIFVNFGQKGLASLLLLDTNTVVPADGSATVNLQAVLTYETDAAQPVPEPTSLAILGSGIVGLVGYGFRRRKQAA